MNPEAQPAVGQEQLVRLSETSLQCLRRSLELIERITPGNCSHHKGNIRVMLKAVLEEVESPNGKLCHRWGGWRSTNGETLTAPAVGSSYWLGTMNIEQEIIADKELRRDTDAIIQRVKALPTSRERSLTITKLQEGVMWLGMDLKRINETTPGSIENPYPSSKDPSTTKIEPTADGLKL